MAQIAAPQHNLTDATLSSTQNSKVADIWGQKPPEAAPGFWSFPPIRKYLLQQMHAGVEAIAARDESREPAPIDGQTLRQRSAATTALTPDGRTTLDFAERWTVETYLADRLPVEKMLSLCCGFGTVERELAQMNAFTHCTAVDLSRGAIDWASRKAREMGFDHINYQAADLNAFDLGQDRYDLVWANGALHHIKALPELLARVYRALKPGGMLVCNEYVGAPYQAFTARHQEIINAVIHLLPHDLRQTFEETFIPVSVRHSPLRRRMYALWRTLTLRPLCTDIASRSPRPEWPAHKKLAFTLYQQLWRLTHPAHERRVRTGRVFEERSRYLKRIDPSEGIASHMIMPTLHSTFDTVNVHPFGLAVLPQAIDAGFRERFDPANPDHQALFDMLVVIEQTLQRAGDLPVDYVHAVAFKKAAQGANLETHDPPAAAA